MKRDSCVSHAPAVLHADVDGEVVLLEPGEGVYFSLDEVGSRIWRALGRRERLCDVHEEVLAEYAVASDTAWTDLVRLVNEMIKAKLLVESPSVKPARAEVV